ncbi:related to longevity-assurance protein LAG1 [Pseudozyma flocculosa]|uniref:Related to longevity-assurance protein LAG1 n=1 Tax=Pseudozyma flocculosa TaxID=84751 RepID=A0A5C3EVX1_9BASI|nr:related to longevity-assurance protein LAG1 [Pseudozyma flocculosa]
MSAPPPARPATGRARAGSLSDAISQVPQNANSQDEASAVSAVTGKQQSEASADAKRQAGGWSVDREDIHQSRGLVLDILTFRWMTAPVSSAKLASIFILSYLLCNLLGDEERNPFRPFLFITHQVPKSQVLVDTTSVAAATSSIRQAIQSVWSRSGDADLVRYQKGYNDLKFLVFYVIVFSFIRQTTTLYFFKPFAKWWGIKGESKQARFTEQGYAVLYWGSAAAFGLYVMSFQESWWYNLEHLWLKYPHWQMRPDLKLYYLLQFAYWLQQALVMLLRLEKPRKDYYELIAHHLVTLWLIGWSYLINLTMIGTTVFVCMDIPDTWLGMAKALNYMQLDTLATGVFAVFMVIWTYFRIYLSAKTLVSVWFQFDLIPSWTREWNPEKGWWLVPWMKYQIFAPLFILLLLNIFWALRGVVADEREEGEDDEEEVEETKKDQ